MPFTRTLRIRSFRWTLQLLKLSVSNVFFLSRADHSWDIEMFRHLFFSGYIFLGRCLRCFETIPGPVHGGGASEVPIWGSWLLCFPLFPSPTRSLVGS